MDSSTIYKHIGATIKQRRRKLKLTKDALSRRLSMSRASLASIETGRQNVLVHQLYILGAALGLTPHDLLPTPSVAMPEQSQEVFPLPDDLNSKQRQQLSKLLQTPVSPSTPATDTPNAPTQTSSTNTRTGSRRSS